MKIYLDVDGALITKDGSPALYVEEFLEFVTQKHDCYWLTTHCQEDQGRALDYLKDFFPGRVYDLLKTVKPPEWRTLKTDAIDFHSDFRWFDDYVMEAELAALERNHCQDKVVRIDLKKNPEQLKLYLVSFP